MCVLHIELLGLFNIHSNVSAIELLAYLPIFQLMERSTANCELSHQHDIHGTCFLNRAARQKKWKHSFFAFG